MRTLDWSRFLKDFFHQSKLKDTGSKEQKSGYDHTFSLESTFR